MNHHPFYFRHRNQSCFGHNTCMFIQSHKWPDKYCHPPTYSSQPQEASLGVPLDYSEDVYVGQRADEVSGDGGKVDQLRAAEDRVEALFCTVYRFSTFTGRHLLFASLIAQF